MQGGYFVKMFVDIKFFWNLSLLTRQSTEHGFTAKLKANVAVGVWRPKGRQLGCLLLRCSDAT